jgi:hypothetical protein
MSKSDTTDTTGASLNTDNSLAVYLYRIDDREGHFYSTIREVPQSVDVELIGVATRHRGDQFNSSPSKDRFRDNIGRLSTGEYWFDDPLPTGDNIAELLYRATWSEDRYLYAATRSEREFTHRDIIGVAVRPAYETIDPTKYGREEFVGNVTDVADGVVWFDGEGDV